MAIFDEESLLATCAYIEGFSLDNYLLLVEYTGRLFREGKAVISGELAGVFERLGSNAENRQARLQKLAAGRLLGRFFAASRARLRAVAERLGVHHLANLRGAMTRPRRLNSKLVFISLFRRRSQESGDLVVHYVWRDRADPSLAIRCGQFGVSSSLSGQFGVSSSLLLPVHQVGKLDSWEDFQDRQAMTLFTTRSTAGTTEPMSSAPRANGICSLAISPAPRHGILSRSSATA